MPRFGPLKRQDLIRYLRQLGFEGPFSANNHQIMQKNSIKISIPNPHEGDIGKELLAVILRKARISKEEWEKL